MYTRVPCRTCSSSSSCSISRSTTVARKQRLFSSLWRVVLHFLKLVPIKTQLTRTPAHDRRPVGNCNFPWRRLSHQIVVFAGRFLNTLKCHIRKKRALNRLQNYIFNPVFLLCIVAIIMLLLLLIVVIMAMETPHLWGTQHNFFSALELLIVSFQNSQIKTTWNKL